MAKFTERNRAVADLYPKSTGENALNENQSPQPFNWRWNTDKTAVIITLKTGYLFELDPETFTDLVLSGSLTTGSITAGSITAGSASISGTLGAGSIVSDDVENTSGNPWGIESGSNANGSYTKFPDGTMIQTGYKADTGTSMTITYPIPFVEEVYTVQCQMVSNAANYQNITIATNYATSLSGVNIIWDSYPNGITWMAIGRWK